METLNKQNLIFMDDTSSIIEAFSVSKLVDIHTIMTDQI